MSIYHFSSGSPVSGIRFRYANDRPPVGLINARNGIPVDQLSTIRRALEWQKWQVVPVTVEGKDVLQVSGFEDEGQLVAFLKAYHFANGNPSILPEPGDHPTRGWQDWFNASGMKTAGWLTGIGDVALFASGLMGGKPWETAAGAIYTAGAGVLARYGNVKTEHHVKQVLEESAEFLKKQAGGLPEDCGLFTILKEKQDGVIHNTEKFLYRYPADVMMGAYTLGAAAMLKAGIDNKRDPWGIAYGVNSLATKAAAFLIPEKKKTEGEKPASGQVGTLVNWIQEKPLRVYGYGSIISDILLGLSAYREYKNDPKQKSYIFKFITTGTYIMAEALLAMAHKDHANGAGKFDEDEQRRIVGLVAEAIARQPKDMQWPLCDQVAGLLSTRPEMKGTASDISRSIKEQMAHMPHHPWACRTNGIMIPSSPQIGV